MAILIDDIPRFPVEFYPIMMIGIILTIAIFISYKFELTNIVLIAVLVVLVILLMYFSGLIDLSIGIYAFLLIPFLIIIVCRNRSEVND